ncbi:hypothetical protein [Nocardioides jiangxiensis]|uniref:Integral membrane protein n=1 Tax=Nocardioides jiangxiensis TaxID=3064524 RepID=A0ABT9B0H5_9ACTN|nr:hypothetical protein [Nocardioides sp. WY-20]MDO7868314.1 hypothetical protein [Nocardioides sp. WY-20]
MHRRATADLVAIRATVVAALSLLLATAAHVLAGGLLPAAWTLVAMVALTGLGAALALDQQASRTRLALLLVGGQTTIHFAMTALAGHGDEGGLRATSVAGALTDAVHHLREDLVADGPMMLAHVAAAVLTGILLGRAERALWTVIDLARRATDLVALVLRLVPVVALRRPVTHVAASSQAPAPLQSRLLTGASVVRRGPPRLLPAC